MRIELPMQLWHGNLERILSLDFNGNELVTAGTDSESQGLRDREGDQLSYDGHIKVWTLDTTQQPIRIVFQYGIRDHIMPVNCVKYSPGGERLASASDDGMVNIYEPRETFRRFGASETSLAWAKRTGLAGHAKEVLDLKWSSSGKYLISSGMDGRAYVWNVQRQMYVAVLSGHNQKYVQGVALDPLMEYALTLGANRELKVWKASQTSRRNDVNFYCAKSIRRAFLKQEEDSSDLGQSFKMFFDQTVPTFYRRPDVSPDGNLFAVPAGQWRKKEGQPLVNCCFLFRRKKFDQPCLVLPFDSPVIACKFCPTKFKLKDPTKRLFKIDYTMILAVASIASVLVYSTDSAEPLYGMGNYHLASITDLAWKGNDTLGISSSDGYCSFMVFGGQLGEQLVEQKENQQVLQKKSPEKVESKVSTISTAAGRKFSMTITPFAK